MSLQYELLNVCIILCLRNESMQLPFTFNCLFERLYLLLLLSFRLQRLFGRDDLCHEFYPFQQNLTLPQGCFDFLLFLLFREVLGVGDSVFFALFNVLLVDCAKSNALGFIETVRLLFLVEGFLCFPLYFFDIGTVKFTLMLFEMQIEVRLRVKVLIAHIALYEPRNCTSFLELNCLYLFLLQSTHDLKIIY